MTSEQLIKDYEQQLTNKHTELVIKCVSLALLKTEGVDLELISAINRSIERELQTYNLGW